MSFVLSSDDEIRKVSYNFNQMDLLIFDAGSQILGLDVDTKKNQIYWTSGTILAKLNTNIEGTAKFVPDIIKNFLSFKFKDLPIR